MPDRVVPSSDFFERRYFAARFTALAILLVMVTWAFLSSSDRSHIRLALAGVFVFTVSSIGLVAAKRFLEASAEQILKWVFGFDLLAVVLLGVAFHAYEDPAYPVLISLPVFYALALRESNVWITGVLSAVAYLVTHALGADVTDMLGAGIIAVKASVIVALGAVLSDSSSRFRQRETEIQLRSEAEEHLNVQLQRRLAELQAVSEITELIHSSLDFDHIGPLVLEILSKVIDVPSCCLFVVDKSRAETLFSATAGLSGARVPLRLSEDLDAGVDAGDDHFACIPVVDYKQTMVVFCAEGGVIERMSEEDKLVVQAVSSELMVAVENSRLYKLTKRLAITDELTGLYNYRFLQQRLDEEIERARRYHKDLSFLMIDVDDFKLFNDTNGHIAGDKALADLAEVMRGVVREVDVVCRYGGEEFSVILPETDAAGAFVVAEKLREAISKHEFANADGACSEHLTVSVGLASFPGHADAKEMLLKMADDALYTAKSGAKNCVRSPRVTPPVMTAPAAGAVVPTEGG